MEKKLPKVFANKIEKKINNNEKIYNSGDINNQEKQPKQQKSENNKKTITNEKTISDKINKIFSSRNYVYKIPVKIQTQDSEIVTKIIGKNKNNIITVDNELIKIRDIKNIEIYEEKNE